jgi:competence/damage-inducible protein CinA-like protein
MQSLRMGSKYKTAQIVVVGSEFFSRDKRDTNSIWLTEELEKRGVRVLDKSIVADDLQTLTRVIAQGLDSTDLVISTGGLGPTEDDRTREAASSALGRELIYHPEIAEELERRFAKRGRKMTENNRRQAYIPEGSWIVPNETGTAPGFLCEVSAGSFVALPGPPREMQGMFRLFLEQKKTEFGSDQVLVRQTLRVTGLGESDMDRKISDLYKKVANPEVTINFTPHNLEIHLTTRATTVKEAEKLAGPLVESMKERLEGYLFSDDDRDLADVVVERLAESGLTLAVAESVTGGHFAHSVCSVSGASQVFLGSVVSYTESTKIGLLGVDEITLKQYSAVSEQTALEMVEGVKAKTGADLCLACTGFAGPSGGTDENPVGTVFVAFCTPEKTTVRRLSLPGSRNLMRSRTTQAMLYMLFKYLRRRKPSGSNSET